MNFFDDTAWENAELSNLLLLYKKMVLDGIRKNNWKELSKRMVELGWERNNDHCHHEVSISIKNSLVFMQTHCHLTVTLSFM